MDIAFFLACYSLPPGNIIANESDLKVLCPFTHKRGFVLNPLAENTLEIKNEILRISVREILQRTIAPFNGNHGIPGY